MFDAKLRAACARVVMAQSAWGILWDSLPPALPQARICCGVKRASGGREGVKLPVLGVIIQGGNPRGPVDIIAAATIAEAPLLAGERLPSSQPCSQFTPANESRGALRPKRFPTLDGEAGGIPCGCGGGRPNADGTWPGLAEGDALGPSLCAIEHGVSRSIDANIEVGKAGHRSPRNGDGKPVPGSWSNKPSWGQRSMPVSGAPKPTEAACKGKAPDRVPCTANVGCGCVMPSASDASVAEGREKLIVGAMPMLESRHGIGPKRGCDCLAVSRWSSASKSCALRLQSPGSKGRPQWTQYDVDTSALCLASTCQAESKALRSDWTTGCTDGIEFINSSRSQLVQKGLKKSPSLGMPQRSMSTLSAFKSPCLRP